MHKNVAWIIRRSPIPKKAVEVERWCFRADLADFMKFILDYPYKV